MRARPHAFEWLISLSKPITFVQLLHSFSHEHFNLKCEITIMHFLLINFIIFIMLALTASYTLPDKNYEHAALRSSYMRNWRPFLPGFIVLSHLHFLKSKDKQVVHRQQMQLSPIKYIFSRLLQDLSDAVIWVKKPNQTLLCEISCGGYSKLAVGL